MNTPRHHRDVDVRGLLHGPRPLMDRVAWVGAAAGTTVRHTVEAARYRLSMARRIVAATAAVLAIASWLVMPSSAATFGGGVTEPYGVVLPIVKDGGPAHYIKTGVFQLRELPSGPVVDAYCIDINHGIHWDATFSDGPATSPQIAYILNTYYPAPGAAVPNGDVNAEVAAVQLAIWHFSDNAWAASSANAGIVARAQGIVNAANAHPTPQADVVSFVVHGPESAAGVARAVTVHVNDPQGHAVANRAVALTVAGGSLVGPATLTTNGSGDATTGVIRDTTGPATLTATTTTTVPAGRTLTPNTGGQELVLASQTMLPAHASVDMRWLTIHKTVTDIETSVHGDSTTPIVVRPGDHVRYDIAVTGAEAPAGSTALTVTDDFGVDLSLVENLSVTGGTAQHIAGRVVTWTLAAAPDGVTTLTASGKVPNALPVSTVTFCNVAVLHNGSDVPSNKACAIVTTTTGIQATKLVDGVAREVVQPDSRLHYRISVTATGTRILSHVLVSDTLKGNGLDLLTGVQPIAPQGVTPTWDPNTRLLTWTIPTMDPGTPVVVGFDATLPMSALTPGGATSCLVNVATVTAPPSDSIPPVTTGPATVCSSAPPPPPPSPTPTPAPTPTPKPTATPQPTASVLAAVTTPSTGASLERPLTSGSLLVLSGLTLVAPRRRNRRSR